jgi:hypothetical protein
MNAPVNRYLRIVIGSLFIIFGAYIIWMEWMPGRFDPKFKIMMGLVVIGYGAYRIAHTYYQRDHQTESFPESETKEEQ